MLRAVSGSEIAHKAASIAGPKRMRAASINIVDRSVRSLQ
jgi:hypothetical protein